MQGKDSTSLISNLESTILELQERVSSLQTTIGQLESDSASADNRCFMLCWILLVLCMKCSTLADFIALLTYI
jgi:hypothetical protein